MRSESGLSCINADSGVGLARTRAGAAGSSFGVAMVGMACG